MFIYIIYRDDLFKSRAFFERIWVLCVNFNVFVYTTSPLGFWGWCYILQGTGKTWPTSQQRTLLGLIQPVFPPRNPGRLTGNRPNSLKATISQPLPSPQVSPLPENLSQGHSLCFPQTNNLTNRHSSISNPVFTLPALGPASHHSPVLRPPLTNWKKKLLGKRAVINGWAEFACAMLYFHDDASVFLSLSEHVWIKCCCFVGIKGRNISGPAQKLQLHLQNLFQLSIKSDNTTKK